MAKKNEIIVKDVAIKTMSKDGIDYISITDIARQKNATDPNGVIANWMRNRNTVEFLGIWETLHNPNFNPLEFEGFRKEAGLNAFTLSPTRWIEATNAIGIVSQAGRYGGTFAQTDIAFEFASWISVEFRLYLVMEFQRLKAKEQSYVCARAEYVIFLPKDWNLESAKEEDYWPIRMLKYIARLPIRSDDWLCDSHSVLLTEEGNTIAPNAGFNSCVILPSTGKNGQEVKPLKLDLFGKKVAFYQLFPLYPEELEFKLKHSFDELMERLDASNNMIININRKNCCPPLCTH